MSPDAIFSAASSIALVGWLVLLASPLVPVWSQRISGLAIPALIGVAYVGLILANWSGVEGDFSSLDGVARLFQSREVLLAGWLHYLAFDLIVGAWEVRAARASGLHFLLVVPCLAATFLFGPAGFVLFLALRAVAARPGAAPANIGASS